MFRSLSVFAVLALCPSLLGAIGLAKGDSYTALQSIRSPFRVVYSVDATTIKMLGGVKGFGDDLSAVAFKRLEAGGVPMKDGTFNPLTVPFVSLDLWVRGVTTADDIKDPKRVFNFQFQAFAPIGDAHNPKSGKHGRVAVWERSVYGVCGTKDLKGQSGDIQDQVRGFLRLCDSFSTDWRTARGITAKAAAQRPTKKASKGKRQTKP